MKERGGILVFLLTVIIFIGGGFFVFKKAQDSVPGEPFFNLKGTIEDFELATTELDPGQRALKYMEFADRRLDELIRIENRGGSPKELFSAAELYWEQEEKAITELQRESIAVITSEPKMKLISVNQKALVIFSRIIDKTPAPEFYSFLEIKQATENAAEKFSR